MSKIVLTRVDSRLIHGQVVTKWLQQSGANEILVVSDELEQDEFLQSIFSARFNDLKSDGGPRNY